MVASVKLPGAALDPNELVVHVRYYVQTSAQTTLGKKLFRIIVQEGKIPTLLCLQA